MQVFVIPTKLCLPHCNHPSTTRSIHTSWLLCGLCEVIWFWRLVKGLLFPVSKPQLKKTTCSPSRLPLCHSLCCAQASFLTQVPELIECFFVQTHFHFLSNTALTGSIQIPSFTSSTSCLFAHLFPNKTLLCNSAHSSSCVWKHIPKILFDIAKFQGLSLLTNDLGMSHQHGDTASTSNLRHGTSNTSLQARASYESQSRLTSKLRQAPLYTGDVNKCGDGKAEELKSTRQRPAQQGTRRAKHVIHVFQKPPLRQHNRHTAHEKYNTIASLLRR